MKVATLASILARYAEALDRAGSRDTASGLRALCKELEASKQQSVREALSKLDAKKSLSRISSLPKVASAIGELAVELKAVLDFVGEQKETVSEHRRVVSASKRNPSKGAATLDKQLVDDYLKRLEAALGDDPQFQALFDELASDLRITKLEAVELATQFLGPTPASTSRSKALQRVLQRHRKVMDFRSASRSIGSKSKSAA